MQAPSNAVGSVTHEGVTTTSNHQTADEIRTTLGIAPADSEPPASESVEAPASDAVAEPPAETAPASKPDAKPVEKSKKDPQKRIDQLTYEREEAKREVARREQEHQREIQALREDMRREFDSLRKPAQPEPTQEPQGDPEPDPGDVSKYPDGQFDRKYLKDQARWEARQEFQEQQRAFAESQQAEQRQRQQFESQNAEQQRLGKFAQKMQTVFAANPALQAQLENAALTRPMWDAVLESAIPDQILTHLVNTPETLDQILALPPLHAHRAMVRLEYELEKAASLTGSAPAPKTTAHPPVTPVSGSHGAPSSGPPGPDASYEEHKAYWNQQEQQERMARR